MWSTGRPTFPGYTLPLSMRLVGWFVVCSLWFTSRAPWCRLARLIYEKSWDLIVHWEQNRAHSQPLTCHGPHWGVSRLMPSTWVRSCVIPIRYLNLRIRKHLRCHLTSLSYYGLFKSFVSSRHGGRAMATFAV